MKGTIMTKKSVSLYLDENKWERLGKEVGYRKINATVVDLIDEYMVFLQMRTRMNELIDAYMPLDDEQKVQKWYREVVTAIGDRRDV